MPLASLSCLQWYGPCAAAMYPQDTGGIGYMEATPHQEMHAAVVGVGTGIAEVLRPYRGYAARLEASGDSFTAITPHQLMKVKLTVNVGAVPSAEDISQAIWNSLSSKYNNPGTMGKTLNSAGSAGDPWIADLSTYPVGTAGYTLASLDPAQIADAIMNDARLLTVAKFLGLK